MCLKKNNLGRLWIWDLVLLCCGVLSKVLCAPGKIPQNPLPHPQLRPGSWNNLCQLSALLTNSHSAKLSCSSSKSTQASWDLVSELSSHRAEHIGLVIPLSPQIPTQLSWVSPNRQSPNLLKLSFQCFYLSGTFLKREVPGSIHEPLPSVQHLVASSNLMNLKTIYT